MGRPNKTNADYFTHDSDMRNDVKIKALRRKFSHMGYAVWCYILEALTDSPEFELPYGEIDRELLAADFDTTPEELNEIVEYSLRLGLLRMTEDTKRLYSTTHKERFSALLARRLRERKTTNIDTENQEKKELSAQIISQNSIIDTDNAYARAKRVEESRVEKRREEKSKEKIESPAPASYQWISDVWNEATAGRLRSVKNLSPSRVAKVKTRLSEMKLEGKDRGEQELYLRELFERAAASDFCCGKNGHNWTMTFDWLFDNDRNWLKLAEGNYDNKKPLSKPNALGVGEYRREDGTRTYGSGTATIPEDAAPRPSDKHAWNEINKQWIIL